MNTPKLNDDWTIYNCHIHTFTRKHTPRWFILWALSDAKRGKINPWTAVVYAFLAYAYVQVLIFLAEFSVSLSSRSDVPALLGYSFAVLLQALMVIPIIALVAIILLVGGIYIFQLIISFLLKVRSASSSSQMYHQLTEWKDSAVEQRKTIIRSNLLINLLLWINPASNDIFERMGRFLKIAEQPTQRAVFEQVERQYPKDTAFIVLPMDMGFMNMGRLKESIDNQHDELLKMAQESRGKIIPFFAADPRHPDIVEKVRENLAPDKFRGVKIYPNLGYRPDHPRLMEIYKLCMKGDYPVLTHCSPGGIWRYGVPRSERRENSKPSNYRDILDMPEYRTLKFCLAHFGGADEWKKHLEGRTVKPDEEPWVRTIYEMIASGKYPNLYADISYTVFTPKIKGLYIDLVDYLKVLLTNERVREKVLFGSDYYMVERESISEKEVSLLLRSRLGEDLYKQIAYTNPRAFLGRGNTQPPANTAKAKTARKKRAAAKKGG